MHHLLHRLADAHVQVLPCDRGMSHHRTHHHCHLLYHWWSRRHYRIHRKPSPPFSGASPRSCHHLVTRTIGLMCVTAILSLDRCPSPVLVASSIVGSSFPPCHYSCQRPPMLVLPFAMPSYCRPVALLPWSLANAVPFCKSLLDHVKHQRSCCHRLPSLAPLPLLVEPSLNTIFAADRSKSPMVHDAQP